MGIDGYRVLVLDKNAVSPQGRPTGCGLGDAADGVKRGWGPSDSITASLPREDCETRLERITASGTRRTASPSMGNAEWARQRIVPGPITPLSPGLGLGSKTPVLSNLSLS